ncbi:GyrI-like domain-containing protein [Streptomyces sp. NPDC050856]|uniref:GyrI-like domain-containing protein n=1 Tax=Streptomyces sp. NPDC050856 TaxID=3154939 RepID=UPI00340BC19A
MSEPVVVERPEQPYVFMRRSVRMDGFGEVADRLPELLGWLAARDIAVAGAPFFRFNTVDLGGVSEVEAGLPVLAPPRPEGDVGVAVLPAGRYATLTHIGHPDQLFGAITTLRKWADEQGLEWDMREVDGVERWGCRIETYRTDPRVQPDPARWETELAFRLADWSADGLATR